MKQFIVKVTHTQKERGKPWIWEVVVGGHKRSWEEKRGKNYINTILTLNPSETKTWKLKWDTKMGCVWGGSERSHGEYDQNAYVCL